MYDKSPSLAELLAKEGFFCEKIVTGRIEYIKIKDFETQIKDAQWLVFTSKNAVAGFAYNAGNVVPAGIKVAVVGKNTQNALRTACGIEADYVSSKATGLALGEELMNVVSGRVSYLCAEVTSASRKERFICNHVSNLLLSGNNQSAAPHPTLQNALLTPAERSILKEIALGKTTKEIAAERNLSFHTVNSHRKNIFRKLNVNNAHEATKYAMKAGIVDLVEYYI